MMRTPTQKLPLNLESRSIHLLQEEFREKVVILAKKCLERGIELGIGTTLRSPDVQAKIWCRSRTLDDVERRKSAIYRAAPTIASLLKPEYAGLGPQLTSHMPMQSWHQLGEAVDVYSKIGTKAIWDGSAALLIATIAKEIGLPHSYNEKTWEVKSRHWHVQLRRKETPFLERGLFDSWTRAEEVMLERFDFTPTCTCVVPTS